MLYLLDVPVTWMGSITRFLTKLCFTSISDVVSVTTSERGLFFIGRLAGGVIMNYIRPRLVQLVCAILTFVATLIVVVCSGTLSLIAFFALYLGESIMFPTIFSLALRDAGTKTKLASSLLIMTIVGGAVAPVIMGYIADTTGSMAIAFLIPLVCYGVIGTYALSNRHVPL